MADKKEKPGIITEVISETAKEELYKKLTRPKAPFFSGYKKQVLKSALKRK